MPDYNDLQIIMTGESVFSDNITGTFLLVIFILCLISCIFEKIKELKNKR